MKSNVTPTIDKSKELDERTDDVSGDDDERTNENFYNLELYYDCFSAVCHFLCSGVSLFLSLRRRRRSA